MNITRILLVFLFGNPLVSQLAFSQSQEDLKYLELLTEDQASSISQRLGIQTGKPINDEIRMSDFDSSSFSSTVPKINNDSFEDKDNLLLDNSNKIFGLDLFKDSPSTFAPIDLAPAPLDYVLGPGDELKIQLFGSITVNRIIPVNREGNIFIPEVGSIEVSGLIFREAKNRINSIINASLIGVTAEVSLSKIRSLQIFVLGNAFSQAYTVSSLSNISNVLFFLAAPLRMGL